jgi:transcriptional regulator with XRE-family HTH domain
MKQPELGRKIVELRKAKGLTQEELVEKCNLNVRTLQRIESGEVTPRSYTIKTIFSALDYAFNSSEVTSGNTGFILTQRLEQVYKYLIDLFNLKTNPMKKISILSLFVVTFSILAFTLNVHSQPKSINPLLGKWRLVGVVQELGSPNDPSYRREKIKIDNSATRSLEFKSNLSFETLTAENSLYNSGVYALINDNSFTTVHAGPTGELAVTSNLYRFEIANDTLHFKGFYLNRALTVGEICYKTALVDEWWVKK